MDSIKKFFDKKKYDVKFKRVGEGKKLTASSPAPASRKHAKRSGPQQRRSAPTSTGQSFLDALQTRQTNLASDVDWSALAIKAEARRQTELEKSLAGLNVGHESEGNEPQDVTVQSDAQILLAVDGVYFYCSIIGPEVDTYAVIKNNIQDFLYGQLEEDHRVASCLIIHTCNKGKEKIRVCIETLCTYIENIVSNPSEEKYHKIRKSNKAYRERVAPLLGTEEFLKAAGFVEQDLPHNDGTETFWVFPKENLCETATLEAMRDMLVSAEPVRPELDRNLRVWLPQDAAEHTQLPLDFFNLSADEIKKEAQLRSEQVEQSQILMTKTLREKLELREIKKYKFCLIRVRFPDSVMLQCTFGVHEKFESVRNVLRGHLVQEGRPFFLLLSGGGKVTADEKTFFELRLVPSVMLNFEWDSDINADQLETSQYLKDETLSLLSAFPDNVDN